jgi:hypothetical protein
MDDKKLMTLLVELHTQNPNDMELGAQVRQLVWNHIQENSPAY